VRATQAGQSSTKHDMLDFPMATTATNRTISVSEYLLRREALANALADLRLEGLAPTPDVRLLLEQFTNGDLNEEQLIKAVLAR